MSILVLEYEFELKFQSYYTVPFTLLDPAGYLVSAGPKLTANAAGIREWVGALVVRDRRLPGAAPSIGLAYVVHRTGSEAEVPEGAGTLVGSFSTHGNEHHWHVFAPKPKPASPRMTAEAASSPPPKASESQMSPGQLSKGLGASPPGPPGPPGGTAGSAPSGSKPVSAPSPAQKA